MELTKNIFFNTDKLVENSKVKISYTGNLYQNGSKEVTVHYGFGNEWNNLGDIKMNNTELGFQAEIVIGEEVILNLCFKNENDEWDNNNGHNYSFPIEKVTQELIVLNDEVNSISEVRSLRKSYIWTKKIKVAIYKIITYLPKIISGNYKKKINNEN